MKKRLFSILLSLAMVITMMPAMASLSFAGETNTTVPVELVKATTSGSRAVKLSWNKVSGATKYVVYGQKCGKKYKKLITTSKTSYKVKKIKKTKLKAHKNYKFYVTAYSGSKKLVTSNSIHFITGKTSGKYANAKSITVNPTSVTLEPGKTVTLNATTKIYKNKKHIKKSHGAATRFVSSKPAVASVSSKGVVTAKKAGTATIYVQDIGGLWCKTTVTVTFDANDGKWSDESTSKWIYKSGAISEVKATGDAAIDEIGKLEWLTDEQKDSYINSIHNTVATANEAIDAATTKADVVEAVAEAKAKIEAKKADVEDVDSTAKSICKDNAKAEVNSYATANNSKIDSMAWLNDEAKTEYNGQIDNIAKVEITAIGAATTKVRVYSAVEIAKYDIDAVISNAEAATTYTITYMDKDDEDFTGENANELPSRHRYGTATTLVPATKEGYTFGGWFTTSDCTGSPVTALGAEDYNDNITLYANWIPICQCSMDVQD